MTRRVECAKLKADAAKKHEYQRLGYRLLRDHRVPIRAKLMALGIGAACIGLLELLQSAAIVIRSRAVNVYKFSLNLSRFSLYLLVPFYKCGIYFTRRRRSAGFKKSQ